MKRERELLGVTDPIVDKMVAGHRDTVQRLARWEVKQQPLQAQG